MKILFLCTGNSTRGPMLEGVFRSLVTKNKLEEKFMCQSAGLAARNGEPIISEAIEVLGEIGIDITFFKTRSFNVKEIPVWDLYYTVSETHAYILEKAGIPRDKIQIPQKHIYDPFGKDLDEYRVCRDHIKLEMEILIEKIKGLL